MSERSREMMDHLNKLGVGKNPIVWVGHSKGGLFVKQMIVDGKYHFWTSVDWEYILCLGNTKVVNAGEYHFQVRHPVVFNNQ